MHFGSYIQLFVVSEEIPHFKLHVHLVQNTQLVQSEGWRDMSYSAIRELDNPLDNPMNICCTIIWKVPSKTVQLRIPTTDQWLTILAIPLSSEASWNLSFSTRTCNVTCFFSIYSISMKFASLFRIPTCSYHKQHLIQAALWSSGASQYVLLSALHSFWYSHFLSRLDELNFLLLNKVSQCNLYPIPECTVYLEEHLNTS